MSRCSGPVKFTTYFCLLSLLVSSTTLAHAGSFSPTPVEHRRSVEQTFLTYPEWFLVYSPAEYAAFIRSRPPSQFPYFGHITQFWESYTAVSRAASSYPSNVGYHVMIVVIGASTTFEYTVKAAYETLIGRLTELTRGGMTDEDRLAASVAQDYVDFIKVRPWYEYDFLAKLGRLWSETTLWGPDMIRKWERKFALTSEYGAKAVYGWLIGKLTKISYDDPLPVTAVWISTAPPHPDPALPDLHVIRSLPDNSAVALVPRYAAFTQYAMGLARNGARFREIAGNESVILVSVLVPREWRYSGLPGDVLFTQPILTQPLQKRVVAVVPVDSLHRVLLELDRPAFEVEHIYDY